MNAKERIQEDLIVQLLNSQIQVLRKILNHIEAGNPINGFVDENVKSVETDLRWLRKYYFNN